MSDFGRLCKPAQTVRRRSYDPVSWPTALDCSPDRPANATPPQYTSSTAAAMHGEPEAITAEEQAQISLQARTKFADERAEQNARRDAKLWAERLRRVELRARSKGVDVYRYQLEVRRAITEMEQATE